MRELPAGTRLLELGPGAAHVARLAGRRDLHWWGLESSLDCLPALARRLSGGAIVELEGLSALPRGCGAALAADVLEHLARPDRVLAQLRDALPPGAVLLVSVPNVANLYVRLALLAGRFPYADRGILDRTHLVFFTRRSLDEALAGAGFRVERRAVSTIPLRFALPRLPAWLVAPLALALEGLTRLFPTLLGFQLLAFARRS